MRTKYDTKNKWMTPLYFCKLALFLRREERKGRREKESMSELNGVFSIDMC
jgi:hypothetical protein